VSQPYILSPGAERDLANIANYTAGHWGEPQARTYAKKLHGSIQKVALGVHPYKDMGHLHPNLRMARCEHHCILCLPQQDAPALIIAILHERMDLIERLKRRLDMGG
jgi:toxin ParE1/3/4